MENNIPEYTEVELETLFNLIYERDEFIATIFEEFTDQQDLIEKFSKFEDDARWGDFAVKVDPEKGDFKDRLRNFYRIMFGDLEMLPLHINDKFNKAIKYRLSIGK